MKIQTIVLAILFTASAAANAAEGEAKAETKPGLLQRGATVDTPIPETYEPLNSTYVEGGEKLNEDIEDSWELKKEAEEREDKAARPPAAQTPEQRALEQRIQEPGSGAAKPPLPQLEKDDKSLRIRESQ